MSKEIIKEEFVQDVQNGMSKVEVMAKYEIPASVAADFAKQCGIKFKKKQIPKYVLVSRVPLQDLDMPHQA